MKKLLVSGLFVLFLFFAAAGCGSKGQQGASVRKAKEIPRIPHKVENSTVCADCHKEGKNKAKVTKHWDRPNCMQCHKSK